MFQSHKWLIVLGMFAGFLGGMASNGLWAQAQGAGPRVISAQTFQLVDANGKRTGSWTDCGGAPCLNLFDENGQARLQVGVYTAAGEKGLPFLVMNNERGEVKALIRLYGPNAAPVIVMKNNSQDRMIMGLDLQKSEEPFLANFDTAGNKKMIFGNFSF